MPATSRSSYGNTNNNGGEYDLSARGEGIGRDPLLVCLSLLAVIGVVAAIIVWYRARQRRKRPAGAAPG
jgi:hypothetical protein